MAASLLAEDNAWFMNESLAFYLSTNTFKNPAFDLAADEADEQPAPTGNVNSGNRRTSESNFLTNLKSHWPLMNNPRETLETFCDNLLFAIRGKVFVVKLNFKHRLSRLKRFLDKRLAGSVGGKQHQAAGSSKPTAEDLLRPAPPTDLANSSSVRDDLFWDKIKPASSAKALELQQARLLNRLEKAKRDSHRLLNTENHLLRHFGELPVRELWESQEELVGQARGSRQARQYQAPLLLSDLLEQSSIGGVGGGGSGGSSKKKSQLSSQLKRTTPPRQANNKVYAGPSCSSVTKRRCIVCYSNRPNIVTIPCEHNEICSDCFIEIISVAVKSSQYPLKCVLCRQKVEKVRCSRQLYADD